MKTSFTIKEIRKYLEGCILYDGNGKEVDNLNFALRSAIATIDMKEDGIREVLAREKHRIEKKSLDRFIGVPCALITGESSGVIKEVDNKNRKLLINFGRYSVWLSTKTFFEKWYWGPNYAVGKESKA